MLIKLATFRGTAPDGEPLNRIFRPGDSVTKVAGTMMPQVQEWLRAYTPEDNKLAVLVNAMGSSEYWGQNVNGDIFPENALVHDCRNHPSDQHPYDDFTGKIVPPYGYWTFLQAFPFVHHRNKDPNRAFGKVVLACWNPRMHRVELIILLDKQLALQHGAQHVIDRILAGEFPDVSMGCKVPYDVCTVCGHKSKTRQDYCNCIRYIGMGKILDDGRRIGVINLHPRFFDISFVFIGADKTAKVMCKLASDSPESLWLPRSVLDADQTYKTACGARDCRDCAGGCRVEGKLKAASAKTKQAYEVQDYFQRGNKIYSTYGTNRKDIVESWKKRGLTPRQAPGTHDHWDTEEEVTDPAQLAEARQILGERAAHESARRAPSRAAAGALLGATGLGILGAATRKPALALGGAAVGALGGGYLGHKLAEQEDPAKVAEAMSEEEATAALMKLVNPKKARTVGPLDMPNNLAFVVDREMKELAKEAPAPRLYFGREDDQEREGKRSLVDGTLRTNATTNETDEFLQPLTPSRGKTASVAEDIGKGTLAGGIGGGLGVGAMELLKSRGKITPGLLKAVARGAGEWGIAGGGTTGALSLMNKKSSALTETFEKARDIKITEPPSPNRKEYPFVGTIDFRGIKIGVECAPGTWRTGKGWKTLMKLPYGEFLANAMGTDKDKLDVYVGPYTDSPNVYIVHQNEVDTGKYDEDKVMLGLRSPEEAKAAYLAHYDNDKFFRSITTMSFPLFKRALLGEEFEGDKVATVRQLLEKTAADFRLEDLFDGHKLARRRQRTWRDETTGHEVNITGSGLSKTASKKKIAAPSAHELLKISAEKWADIVKEVGPDKAVGRVSPLLSAGEPELPTELLNQMGEGGLGPSLSTASMMGMVLKPEEFQRILLAALGKTNMADTLEQNGEVFAPQSTEAAPCPPLEAEQMDPRVLERLLPHLREKSYFGPVIRHRIIRIIAIKPPESAPQKEVTSPLLSKVGSAYNWYRREQMKLAGDAMRVVPNVPALHSGLYGLDDVGLFDKTANWVNPKTLAVILGAIPLTLMYSAHQRRREERGEELNLIQRLIADHPWFATLATSAALREILKTPQAQAAVDEALAAGQRIWKGQTRPGL